MSGVGDNGRLGSVHRLFNTHPPLEERIEALRIFDEMSSKELQQLPSVFGQSDCCELRGSDDVQVGKRPMSSRISRR